MKPTDKLDFSFRRSTRIFCLMENWICLNYADLHTLGSKLRIAKPCNPWNKDPPVCWNRKSGPWLPVLSKLRKTPTSLAQGLCCMKAWDAGHKDSSAPLNKKMTGAAIVLLSSAISNRAISNIIPTHDASSDAPATSYPVPLQKASYNRLHAQVIQDHCMLKRWKSTDTDQNDEMSHCCILADLHKYT